MKIIVNEDIYTLKNENNHLVLFNLNTSMYFGLDSIGTIFWEHIDKYEYVNEIVKKLSNHFDNSEIVIENDLEMLVLKLKDKELIKIDY